MLNSFQRVEAIDYRLLIEQVPAIIYIAAFDTDSSTIYVSPQIEGLLGFSQDEWMSDHTLWCVRIHPDDRPRVLAELDRIHAGGEPIPCEYRMLARDGHVVWFRDNAAIQRDQYGLPISLYGVMLDITDRKQLQTELADTQHQLVRKTISQLNQRDLTILQMIYGGYTDRKISQELAIAERTVRYCLQRICNRLNVSNRHEAVYEASRLNLIDIDRYDFDLPPEI